MGTQDLGQYRHTGREVVTNEFARILNRAGANLPDDLKLSKLDYSEYTYYNGVQNKPFTPEVLDWFNIYFTLDGPQKSQLGQAIRAAKGTINTVGRIRNATVEEIASARNEYGHIPNGMSPLRAAFLKAVLETKKENSEAS